jgi:hypothetical protein
MADSDFADHRFFAIMLSAHRSGRTGPPTNDNRPLFVPCDLNPSRLERVTRKG